MEIILAILGKLEYLESLVKLARKNRDEGLSLLNLTKVMRFHAMHKISMNKTIVASYFI
jgi:hypothetical protein